ncbi:MAG TPA: hypothetical protein VGE24_14970 [Emticicia sp.]
MTRYDILLGRNNIIITHAGFNNQQKIKAEVSLNGGRLVTLVSEFANSAYKFYDIEKLLPDSSLELPSFVNNYEAYPEAVQELTFRFFQGQVQNIENYPILLGAGLGKRKQNLSWLTNPLGKFLTHQPANKKTTEQDEEYLYFLNNFNENLANICVRVAAILDDSNIQYFDAILITSPDRQLYSFDVSAVSVRRLFYETFEENEELLGKQVVAYRVQVFNRLEEPGDEPYNYVPLSEYRYYEIVNYSAKDIYMTFRNSFGVFDTLRLIGNQKQSQVVVHDEFEMDEGVRLADVNFYKKLVVNAGEFEQKWLEYLQELVISKEIYVRTRAGYQRLLCTTKELKFLDTSTPIDEAQLEFRYVENENNFAQ